MQPEQNYASHRRYHPLFHFFAFPILLLSVFVQIYFIWRYRTWMNAWGLLVSIALVVTLLLARSYSLRQQDRIIRLEERLRMQMLLPDDLRSRINELRTSQLVALRFCCDEELPELTRAVLAGECSTPEEIKRRVRTWRPDHHRI